MAASLTLTFDDPQTVALLLQYSQFIRQEDGVEGTLQEVAAGLVVGCLDEHHRFAKWAKENRAASGLPTSGDNVRHLPAPKPATERPDEPLRRASA